MIAPLRRRHRLTFLVLAIVLPAVLVVALTLRESPDAVAPDRFAAGPSGPRAEAGPRRPTQSTRERTP